MVTHIKAGTSLIFYNIYILGWLQKKLNANLSKSRLFSLADSVTESESESSLRLNQAQFLNRFGYLMKE